MGFWMEDFQYRVGIVWWTFGSAGAGALKTTLLTVSFQAVKALMNPVRGWRSE
jgi:putative ABC transport system permease protein